MSQALVEVVRSFNDKDRPGYALAGAVAILLTRIAITGLASLGVVTAAAEILPLLKSLIHA